MQTKQCNVFYVSVAASDQNISPLRSATAFELSELDTRKIKYGSHLDIYGGLMSEQRKVSYCVLWEDSSCVQYESTSDEEQKWRLL
jgi:hypothetical protein